MPRAVTSWLAFAALHFPLAHPCVSVLIPGAVTPEEVTSNVRHMAAHVPDGVWADLKDVGVLHPDCPTP